tara:strand:- start:798 stop:1064 length:267 start_codon:yes stop_codon:yes gene_type:complete
MDKNIGKVVFLNLPNIKRPQYRWIVRKRDDGRYIVRVPKIGILLRNLHLKRNADYGKESLLPNGSKLWKKTKTLKVKKKFKNKTKKTL